MTRYLEELPASVETIAALKECILANIVLLGQIPAPTFKEKQRAAVFLERLAEFQVDECTFDGYRNPIGIIRGASRNKPPIFIVAHLDTFSPPTSITISASSATPFRGRGCPTTRPVPACWPPCPKSSGGSTCAFSRISSWRA